MLTGESTLNHKTSLLKSPIFLGLVGIIIAVFIGAFSALFAGLVGENYGVLLAVPAAMVIGIFFLMDYKAFFFLIILFRSAMDPVFDATKLGGFGLGAVLNAIVILIAAITLIEKDNPARKIFATTWLPFLILSSFTLAIAPDVVTAVKQFLALLSYSAMLILAISLIRSEADYGRWMRAVFISSLVPVVFGFIDAATGGVAREEGFRIRSTFSHPNVFAFYLVMMISLGFYFFKTKFTYFPKWVHKYLPIYILLMIALLVMTKTRSAWVALFMFFTLYALIYERKYLLFICCMPFLALLIPSVAERITDLGQGNEVINYSKLNSYAWRKLIWHDGLSFMSVSHYFLGYGLGSFFERSPDFFTMSGGRKNGAHSVFVQLFFETGALGLAAYIWVHLKTAKLLIPFYKKNKLMIFTMIMFLLEFAFEAYADNMLAYLTYTWYLWFVLGAAYAINSLKPQDLSTEVKKSNE